MAIRSFSYTWSRYIIMRIVDWLLQARLGFMEREDSREDVNCSQ